MLLLKPARWRTVIAILLAGVILNFTSVSTAHAGFFSGVKKFFTKTINPVHHIKKAYNRSVNETGQKIADHITNSVDWSKIGQELAKGASPELLKALNSINWEQYGQQVGAGIRTEFEAAMDKLFDDKIKPLLTDIDNLLKTRSDQADNATEARLKQLDKLVDDNLKKVDVLIQHTVDRFQAAADETIAKVRIDIIDYARDIFVTERDKTVAQIRAEVIDYAAATVKKTTDDIVAKVKAELIDHTFAQIDQLRYQFRQDVEHFFNRAENLIVLLDCTEENIRFDLDRTRDKLDKLGEKYLKELKALTPQAQMSKLFSPSGQPSTKPTTSTATDDSCYQQLGVTALEGFEYSTIYDLKKCKVLNTLTPETPARRVQNVYWDLHMFAKRVGCIQRNPSHFMWDWMAFESRYQFWATYRY